MIRGEVIKHMVQRVTGEATQMALDDPNEMDQSEMISEVPGGGEHFEAISAKVWKRGDVRPSYLLRG